MQSWDIDPVEGDYILDKGSPVTTNSLRVPAYFRLKVKRTQWMYAPDSKYGSDFYTVKKRSQNNSTQRLESIAAKALQPIVDDGRASTIEAEVTDIPNRNAVEMDITVTDNNGEVEKTTFNGLTS